MNSLQTSSFSLVSLFTLLSLLPTILSTESHAPAPAPQSNDDAYFIRSSCNLTLYPYICYTSLYPYAALVHGNSSLLAQYAVSLCLTRAQNMLYYINSLSRQVNTGGGGSPQRRCKAALKDCYSTFDDAVDQIQRSVEEMMSLGDGEKLRIQMSNVLTWMSAALTNEDTCTDGFDEVECNGEVKVGVCRNGEVVKRFTSNGLALVNKFANEEGARGD